MEEEKIIIKSPNTNKICPFCNEDGEKSGEEVHYSNRAPFPFNVEKYYYIYKCNKCEAKWKVKER